jgi:hypothetical protein
VVVWSSSVPDAYDALVGVLSTATALEGVTVLDGPVVSADPIMEAVTVGFEDESLSAVEDGSNEHEGLSRARDRETFTINCAVQVLLGSSTDMPTARRRAYALFSAVGGALADNPRLGGAVDLAVLGAHTLTQPQTPQGALAQIAFGVDCQSYSRR